MNIRILNTEYDLRIPRHQDEIDRAIKLADDLAEYSAGELQKAIAGTRGLPTPEEKQRVVEWIRIYVPFAPIDRLVESEPEELLNIVRLIVAKVRAEIDGPPHAPRIPPKRRMFACEDLARPHSRRGMFSRPDRPPNA